MNTNHSLQRQVEVAIKVRYGETDQMGVVYHAHYLAWFNVARDELLKTMGIHVGQGEKLGYLMPIVEASCQYKFPARYDDELIVRAAAEPTTVARLTVHYEIYRKKDWKLLAQGKTVNVLMKKNGSILLRIPKELDRMRKDSGCCRE